MSGFARHRTSRRIIANFTGFEADLLRSLQMLHDHFTALPSGGTTRTHHTEAP